MAELPFSLEKGSGYHILIFATEPLMSIAITQGDRERLIRYRDQGLAMDPASFIIRENYLFALQLKWGGSIKEMDSFLEQTRTYYAQNPSLKQLEGFPAYTQADMVQKRDPELALQLYTQAIAQRKNWWFIYERGARFYGMKQYRNAISDFTRALRLNPQSSTILEKRGLSYLRLNELEKADTDLKQSFEFDPFDPDILKTRGHLFVTKGKFPLALNAYNQALVYGEHQPSVWRSIGQLYFYSLHNFPAAENAYQRALDLDPSDQNTQLAYQRVLIFSSPLETWRDYVSKLYLVARLKILEFLWGRS